MATRNLVINDPVGIHARPAAMFAQAVTASGQTVTIAKEGGNAVPAGSILSIMGLGIKQGDTVVINVEGDNAEAVADNLAMGAYHRKLRRLVAIDLAGEPGEVSRTPLWTLGGPPLAGNAEGLRGSFFFGPPLPSEGRLFAVVEKDRQLSVVSIRARDGAVPAMTARRKQDRANARRLINDGSKGRQHGQAVPI